MGLDMYLTASVYVSNPTSRKETILEEARLTPFVNEDVNFFGVTVESTIHSWRKANAIHAWFVKNVQDSKDDCGSYYVSTSDLRQLRATCQKVLNGVTIKQGDVYNGESWSNEGHVIHTTPGRVITNPEWAAELLPTQSGFFFGGTDYDEWYLRDLEDTVQAIDSILDILARRDHDEPWVELQYRSSW